MARTALKGLGIRAATGVVSTCLASAACAMDLSVEPLDPSTAALRASGQTAGLAQVRSALPRSGLPLQAAQAQSGRPEYSSQLNEYSYRFWGLHGMPGIGVGVDALAYTVRATGSAPQQTAQGGAEVLLPSSPVLTLDMRSQAFAKAADLRYFHQEGSDVVVGKVGIDFKAARSRLSLRYGDLGLKMSEDTHMTLRVHRGGVGIFMRRSF